MRTLRSSAFVALISAAAFTGCVQPTWNAAPGPQRAEKIGVSADLPAGWSRFNPDAGLTLTRDGLLLQSVVVTRDAYDTKIPNTDRKITAEAEAYEAAQILVDAFNADQSRHHLELLDNKPIDVGGLPGFRLELTYQTAEGLTMHETLYVALTEDSYVIVRYKAPHRFYHERDAGAFEQIVASLKIDPRGGKKKS